MAGSPDDIEALKIALAFEPAARLAAEAKVSSIDALVASLKLQIETMRRELYGQRSERKARLQGQMELELEDLEADATEDELKAEMAADETTEVRPFTRKKPSRKPFPEHFAARTGGHPWSDVMRRLRIGEARQAWGGYHRDTGGDPSAMEGDPVCPRKIHLPAQGRFLGAKRSPSHRPPSV